MLGMVTEQQTFVQRTNEQIVIHIHQLDLLFYSINCFYSIVVTGANVLRINWNSDKYANIRRALISKR